MRNIFIVLVSIVVWWSGIFAAGMPCIDGQTINERRERIPCYGTTVVLKEKEVKTVERQPQLQPRFQMNAGQNSSLSRPVSRENKAPRDPLARGWDYLVANRYTLSLAKARYGVSIGDIVAILRHETNFGIHLGFSSAVETLRSKGNSFQLECLQRIAIQERWTKQELESIPGSSAGAIGDPQFMPCSWLAYAVDGDGDGRVDLFDSANDIIMSVANFLASNGWMKNRKRALMAYNRDGAYVDAVMKYSGDLEVRRRTLMIEG